MHPHRYRHKEQTKRLRVKNKHSNTHTHIGALTLMKIKEFFIALGLEEVSNGLYIQVSTVLGPQYALIYDAFHKYLSRHSYMTHLCIHVCAVVEEVFYQLRLLLSNSYVQQRLAYTHRTTNMHTHTHTHAHSTAHTHTHTNKLYQILAKQK
jgi:hypothetical protein